MTIFLNLDAPCPVFDLDCSGEPDPEEPDFGPFATDFWYCNQHGIIADARYRTWDNGDADPLHATVAEDYCPRCGIECLPLGEWLIDFWEDHP